MLFQLLSNSGMSFQLSGKIYSWLSSSKLTKFSSGLNLNFHSSILLLVCRNQINNSFFLLKYKLMKGKRIVEPICQE
jgi:hypothetical protein